MSKPPKQSKLPPIAKKGLVICHIGDGKGKTTAAMGLAARASGADLKVYILQFVKAKAPEPGEARESGEWPLSNEIIFFNAVSIPSRLGKIETEQVGSGFVGILGDQKAKDQHIREAVRGLEIARRLVATDEYQLVILDELLSAVELTLLTEADVLELIALKHPDVHLVITGHKRFKKIIATCDLVTEMKLVKHPYYKNVLAQKGIDF